VRFFLLAGMVRHEFWLHQLRPEDYGFVADADSLTMSARRQDSSGTACAMKLTEAEASRPSRLKMSGEPVTRWASSDTPWVLPRQKSRT